jgi:hypothetical protein
MDKGANVVLQFDKVNDAFWLAMHKVTDKKEVTELGNDVYALLPVKSYSLEDHQFIQIKFDINEGKEVKVWTPRNNVKTIVEGKTDMRGAFSFAGSTIK